MPQQKKLFEIGATASRLRKIFQTALFAHIEFTFGSFRTVGIAAALILAAQHAALRIRIGFDDIVRFIRAAGSAVPRRFIVGL